MLSMRHLGCCCRCCRSGCDACGGQCCCCSIAGQPKVDFGKDDDEDEVDDFDPWNCCFVDYLNPVVEDERNCCWWCCDSSEVLLTEKLKKETCCLRFDVHRDDDSDCGDVDFVDSKKTILLSLSLQSLRLRTHLRSNARRRWLKKKSPRRSKEASVVSAQD